MYHSELLFRSQNRAHCQRCQSLTPLVHSPEVLSMLSVITQSSHGCRAGTLFSRLRLMKVAQMQAVWRVGRLFLSLSPQTELLVGPSRTQY